MFEQTDLKPVLGRVADGFGTAPEWTREGAALGMCLAGPWGGAGELKLSSLGRHPDSPLARYLAPSPAPKPFALDADLLARVFKETPSSTLEPYVDPLNLYLARYEIHSVARIACFLGQVGLESQGFKRLEENLKYTQAERLTSVFGSAAFGDDDPADFVRSPEKLANRVYASKNGNGDIASGDGWTYRGRGLIQLTGRSNYAAFAARSGVDVVAKPDLLLKPSYAVMSACDFFKTNGLAALADAGKLEELTRRVNRKKLHLKERIAATQAAAAALRTALQGVRW